MRRRALLAAINDRKVPSEIPTPPFDNPLYIGADWIDSDMGTDIYYNDSLGQDFYLTLKNYLKEITSLFGEEFAPGYYHLEGLSSLGLNIYFEGVDGYVQMDIAEYYSDDDVGSLSSADYVWTCTCYEDCIMWEAWY